MKEKYLIVVDMQNDFVTGPLGTAEARGICGKAARTIRDFPGRILYTKDTHTKDYLNTREGRMLPVEHCIRGSFGWQLIPEIVALQEAAAAPVFEKQTFGSIELARFLLEKYRAAELESVTLIGVCTDICVISNALLIKAYMPELPVSVVSSCCAGATPEKHEAALKCMESCQILLTG